MQCNLYLNPVSILLLAAFTCNAQDNTAQDHVAEDDKPFLLNYPNIEDSDGKVVLTNDRVVLQRLVVGAGEWEGVHSHPDNQVYIHINSGMWSEHRGGVQSAPSAFMQAGSVGWVGAIDISEGHEWGNTGDPVMEFVLVTIK